MVLHAQVIGGIGRTLVKGLTRYYKLEGKAFNKLYTGFPRSRTIGRGVRHGLTAGSTIGSLIAPDSPGNDDAIQKRSQYQTRPPDKTRYRQTGRYRSKRTKYYKPKSGCRCPRPRKYTRSRNRFNY